MISFRSCKQERKPLWKIILHRCENCICDSWSTHCLMNSVLLRHRLWIGTILFICSLSGLAGFYYDIAYFFRCGCCFYWSAVFYYYQSLLQAISLALAAKLCDCACCISMCVVGWQLWAASLNEKAFVRWGGSQVLLESNEFCSCVSRVIQTGKSDLCCKSYDCFGRRCFNLFIWTSVYDWTVSSGWSTFAFCVCHFTLTQWHRASWAFFSDTSLLLWAFGSIDQTFTTVNTLQRNWKSTSATQLIHRCWSFPKAGKTNQSHERNCWFFPLSSSCRFHDQFWHNLINFR